jgi:hypothetical protein
MLILMMLQPLTLATIVSFAILLSHIALRQALRCFLFRCFFIIDYADAIEYLPPHCY